MQQQHQHNSSTGEDDHHHHRVFSWTHIFLLSQHLRHVRNELNRLRVDCTYMAEDSAVLRRQWQDLSAVDSLTQLLTGGGERAPASTPIELDSDFELEAMDKLARLPSTETMPSSSLDDHRIKIRKNGIAVRRKRVKRACSYHRSKRTKCTCNTRNSNS
jgi:hypothetical protein